MTRGVPDPRLIHNRRQITAHVLVQARRWGWTDEHTLDVLEAQLAPTRVMWAIQGPCVYCGDWIASVVDHVIPVTRGGTNDADNLVSACVRCNTEKRDALLSEWIGVNYRDWRRWLDMEAVIFA